VTAIKSNSIPSVIKINTPEVIILNRWIEIVPIPYDKRASVISNAPVNVIQLIVVVYSLLRQQKFSESYPFKYQTENNINIKNKNIWQMFKKS